MKTVLITGATSGIGKETAIALAQKNYKLILCGRNQQNLDELKSTLKTDVYTYCFDVRDKHEVFAQINNLPEEFQSSEILINTVGSAHRFAPFDQADLEELEAMIDINVKGLI